MCRWKKIRKDISSAGIRVGKGMEAEKCEGTIGGGPSVWLQEWVSHILTSSANETLLHCVLKVTHIFCYSCVYIYIDLHSSATDLHKTVTLMEAARLDFLFYSI